MTWAEFKRRVEELGIKGEDPIRWIDVHGQAKPEEIAAAKDGDGKVAIYT
jgi:hypothetical protein